MKTHKVIKTEKEYEAVMARIDQIFDAKPGTPEGDELELLLLLVEKYEDEAFPIELPDPITAIRFRMEQQGLAQKDLEPYLGSKSKVSEVMSGRRGLSLTMIRKLVDGLGIPAEVLLREPGTKLESDDLDDIRQGFPIAEMRKRGWFEGFSGTLAELNAQLDEHLEKFLRPLNGNCRIPALNRQRIREGSRSDPGALQAWRIRVIGRACRETLPEYQRGSVTRELLSDVVKLSYLDEGPLLARQMLNKRGVHLIVEPHLPKTHLDGAAMTMPDGSRLVALTARHDRLDNFWFTLLHELAHINLHLDGQEAVEAIFDDLDNQSQDEGERQADQLASASLIPPEEWAKAELSESSDDGTVRALADRLRIHPSIIAGRIRFQSGNYKIMNHLVGKGAVRKFFERESNGAH